MGCGSAGPLRGGGWSLRTTGAPCGVGAGPSGELGTGQRGAWERSREGSEPRFLQGGKESWSLSAGGGGRPPERKAESRWCEASSWETRWELGLRSPQKVLYLQVDLSQGRS